MMCNDRGWGGAGHGAWAAPGRRRAGDASPSRRRVENDAGLRACVLDHAEQIRVAITPAMKFRMLLHTNPMRERGECLGSRAGASEDM